MLVALLAGVACALLVAHLHLLLHEGAHAAVYWAFFRGRAAIRVRFVWDWGGLGGRTTVTRWSGAPPTASDLRHLAYGALAGPAVTLVVIAALAIVAASFWPVGGAVKPVEGFVLIATLPPAVTLAVTLAMTCWAPGHDLRAARSTRCAPRGDHRRHRPELAGQPVPLRPLAVGLRMRARAAGLIAAAHLPSGWRPKK